MARPPNPRTFKLGLVQMRCTPDPARNLSRAIELIHEAAGLGAEIICLPELFRTQYFCQTEDHSKFDLAEAIPGPSTTALGAVARERQVVLVVSLFERRAAGLYHNTAVIIDSDGAPVGKYRKMHIPDDPLFYEKYYFAPGDTGDDTSAAANGGIAAQASGFRVWKTRFANIGVLICWDQWYPEAARITALLGADILFYPTAIGWHPSEKAEFGAAQVDAWRTMQRSHAIANGVFVASPNRIGHEDEPGTDGIEFFGNSFIADPFGRILASAGTDQETLVVACDPKLIEETRRNWPFLRDRRIDAYGPILSRYLGS
jgi:N-carbamoylputrescine amidase